jgi:HEPN domain-containing protein
MRDKEVRRFLRAARQRLTSASILFEHDMFLDCMYLAGYAVECALKSMILANVPLRSRRRYEATYFRGAVAHDFEYLNALLRKRRVVVPVATAHELRRITAWSTDLRYEVGQRPSREAQRYVNSARQILAWAERSV